MDTATANSRTTSGRERLPNEWRAIGHELVQRGHRVLLYPGDRVENPTRIGAAKAGYQPRSNGPEGRPRDSHPLEEKHDDLRMLVLVSLYANADSAPPGSGGLPATVKGNEVFPDTTGLNTCWVFDYSFVLQFGDGGHVGTYKYTTHRWLKCQARGQGPVYAPRRLIRIVKPQKDRLARHAKTPPERDAENFALGNFFVTWEFVSKGLGVLRKKFT